MIQLNAGGTTFSYVTQVGDTPTTVVKQFASQISEDPTANQVFMANANGPQLVLYNISALGTEGNGVQSVFMSSDASLVGSFGGAATQIAPGATSGGQTPPGPQFTPIGTVEPVFGYVPIIRVLEGDMLNARINLDTLQADVWKPRQDELKVRYALLKQYRMELADRLSVPIDPDLVGNRGMSAQRVV
jgi:hypothetical protein